MSIHIMTQVWKHSKQRGAGLLTLLALADWADDDGYAYPSVEKLARKARVSTRTVQRLTDGLVEANELHIEAGAGPNGVHLYQVTPPVGGDILSPRHARPKRVASTTKEGDNDGAQMSPNTSLTIKEPSEESERSRPSALRPDAIELHRRLTHRYLHKSTWSTINRVVGSGFPALLRWGRLVRAWKLAGYNVTNAKGMLEVYRNGWERRGPSNTRDPNYSAAADVAAFKKERGLK